MRFFICIFFLFCISANADTRNARIFKIGDTKGKPIYLQETNFEINKAGERIWSSVIKDPEGNIVMTEKAVMKDARMISQSIEQRQMNEAYELSVYDKEVTFQNYTLENGSKIINGKPVTTKVDDNFIMGPATEFYLQNRWEDLRSGKKINVDFGIFELTKIVGFNFIKVKEDETILELKMTPSNIFINMLVDPIFIEFDKKERRMLRFKGRTPLRQKIDGEWKPLDAEILYP